MSVGGEAWARTLLEWTYRTMRSIENNQFIWYKTEEFHRDVLATYTHVKRERAEATDEEKEKCIEALKEALEFVDEHSKSKNTEEENTAAVEEEEEDGDLFA